MSKRSDYRIVVIHETGFDVTLPWLRVGDRVEMKGSVPMSTGVLTDDRGSVLRLYEEPRLSGSPRVMAMVKFDEVSTPVSVWARSLRVLNPVEDIGGLA